MEMTTSDVGGNIDGTLQQYGVFDQQGLVSMPSNLNFVEAASLTCAGLTAWNALFGVEGKRLMPGDWVLTEGTGGVSIFALQVSNSLHQISSVRCKTNADIVVR